MSPTPVATPVSPTLRRRRGMTEEAAIAAVDQACRRLRLPTIRALVDEALSVAKKEQLTYQGFLAELLLAEVDDRDRRSSVRRVKAAGFPRDKWLGDFDFDANPNVNPATIHTLANGDWIRRGEPLRDLVHPVRTRAPQDRAHARADPARGARAVRERALRRRDDAARLARGRDRSGHPLPLRLDEG